MNEVPHEIGYYTSTYTDDEGDTFIIVETAWAGKLTGAAVVFPVDAAPAIAHSVLDAWSKHYATEEDPTTHD